MFKNKSENRFSRLVDGKRFRPSEQPWDQLYKVFGAAGCLFTRCPVDSTRVLGCYRFYFLRFLLICQLESLYLTFTLKWFFSLKIYTISEQFWEQGVQGVLSQNCKNILNDFSP